MLYGKYLKRTSIEGAVSLYLSEKPKSQKTSVFQRKAKCVEALMGMKSVTAVGRWYMKEYGYPAPSTSSLLHWRQETQVLGVVGHRIRSGLPALNNSSVANIGNAFQKDLTKSLSIAIAELGTPFSTT